MRSHFSDITLQGIYPVAAKHTWKLNGRMRQMQSKVVILMKMSKYFWNLEQIFLITLTGMGKYFQSLRQIFLEPSYKGSRVGWGYVSLFSSLDFCKTWGTEQHQDPPVSSAVHHPWQQWLLAIARMIPEKNFELTWVKGAFTCISNTVLPSPTATSSSAASATWTSLQVQSLNRSPPQE